MQYGYESANYGELIKEYKTKENKIVVHFLDGAYYEIPLTEDNEKELQNIMISQAMDRENSGALKKTIDKRNKTVVWIVTKSLLAIIGTIATVSSEDNLHKIIAGVLTGITGISVVVSGVKYALRTSEIEELQKYAIFLDIREKLEQCIDPNIFNGVKSKTKVLNINTLDDFSLKDMKKIKSNLQRSEIFYSRLIKDKSSKGQTRVRTKEQKN